MSTRGRIYRNRIPLGRRNRASARRVYGEGAYLQHLQLLQTLLHQLLHLPRVRHILVLVEGIDGPTVGILAEVVCLEVAALS